MQILARYRCSVCNYIYDEDKKGIEFQSLPNSWACPVCGAPKTAFVLEGISKGDESIKTNVAEIVTETDNSLWMFPKEYMTTTIAQFRNLY